MFHFGPRSASTPDMRHITFLTLLTLILVALSGCSSQDQAKANSDRTKITNDAKQDAAKVEEEAKRLGNKVRDESKELGHKAADAMGGPADQTLSEKATRAEAGAKRVGTEVVTAAEQEMLVARVKGQIEQSLGAASLTGVHVDTKGRVVTLTGSVSSADEKRRAQLAAAGVTGVDHVVNQIVVNPS